MKSLAELLQRPIQRWIDRKLPPTEQAELGLNNIMILPTRLGLGLLVLCALIFLLAINYENSMGFALCFFLLSLWLLALHATFQNLSGLVIHLQSTGQAHVGDEVMYEFGLSDKQGRAKYSVEGFWQEQNRSVFDIQQGQKSQHKIFCLAEKRGYLRPGRLQLVSYFPLMLFRAWSSVAFIRQALIFPKPVACVLPQVQQVLSGEQHAARQHHGHDELAHLRNYQTGDPLHLIAWKASAKQVDGLITKSLDAPAEQRIWLDYQTMPGPDHELRLSQLCYWCIELEQRQVYYGLNLPGQTIGPNRGAQHYINCLTALAKQPEQSGFHAVS